MGVFNVLLANFRHCILTVGVVLDGSLHCEGGFPVSPLQMTILGEKQDIFVFDLLIIANEPA